jgi:transposase
MMSYPSGMADEDTRSLSGAAQAALRNRAVQAVLDGMTQAEAARVFRVHPNAVNRWIRRYREGGWAGLGEQRRGRRPGEQPALSERQQQELIALVRDSTPDQLGLTGFLWTREAVGELLAQRYGVWLGADHGRWVAARLGVQPPAAAAARPGAEPGGGCALAGHRVPRHPRPGQAGGWGGVVAG